MIRPSSSAFAVALICLVAAASCQAGTKVRVGRNWPAAEQVSIDQVDHAAWDALLKKHCDARGFVNYKAWKASPQDLQALDAYLANLSRASRGKQASKAGRLAYWINAYNAVTVKGILREYPTSSIRNHTAKAFGYNVWKDLLLTVGDEQYSLDQMEHEVLRKMGRPQMHFAIVCASIGCPRLLDEAYLPARIDEQLERNAKDFFADRTKFRADAAAETIYVSPILKWFATDFGGTTAEQMATIAPLLPDEEARRLAKSGSARVRYLDYDWGLNDQARLPQTADRR